MSEARKVPGGSTLALIRQLRAEARRAAARAMDPLEREICIEVRLRFVIPACLDAPSQSVRAVRVRGARL